MPSFEETNNPGYDEAFGSIKEYKNSFFFNSAKYKKIDELLNCNLLITVFYFVSKGYSLDHKQEGKLKELFLCDISSNDNYNLVEKLFEQNIPIDEKYIGMAIVESPRRFQYFFNISNYSNYEDTARYWRNQHPLFNEYIHKKIKNGTFSNLIFKGWKQFIKDMANDDVEFRGKKKNNSSGYLYPEMFFNQKIFCPVDEFKDYLFKGIAEEEYKECIELIKKIPLASKRLDWEDRKRYKKHSFGSERDSLMKLLETKKFYINNVLFENEEKEKEKYSVAIIIANKSEEDFPEGGLKLIKEIIKAYDEINQNKDILSLEEKFGLNKLYYDKFPSIIENYLSIKSSYKTESTISIFNEILNDINDIFKNYLDNINKVKMKELNVSKKYFSQIKKSM